MGLYKKLEDHA